MGLETGLGEALRTDYFLLRGRQLDVDDLYRRGGRYEYSGGVNPAALVALVAGVVPCVPGFLNAAFPKSFPDVGPLWKGIYSYAWFAGFGIAGLLYVVLMRGRAKR